MEHTIQWVGWSLDPVTRSAIVTGMAMSRPGQPTIKMLVEDRQSEHEQRDPCDTLGNAALADDPACGAVIKVRAILPEIEQKGSMAFFRVYRHARRQSR